MLVSELYESKFLKADDIGKRSIPVEIDRVELAEFDKKVSIVLGFKNKRKLMRLNKTNGLELQRILGDDTGQWIGATAIITTRPTLYQGKQTNGLTLLNVIPNPNPQPKPVENLRDDDDDDIPF